MPHRNQDNAAAGPGDTIAAIEVAPVFCDMCGWGLPDPANKVRILEITQIEDGWLAEGHLAFGDYCPECGDSYSVLREYIPIECAEFECPKCGPNSAMTPDVLNIKATGEGYLFTATITCSSCSKPRMHERILSSFKKVKRLKIGATGVEVELSN